MREPWDANGRIRLRDSAGVAALLGWLVPGLGHLWLGRPGKALHYFLAIGAAWALGLRLTEGLGISYERHPIWLAAEAWLAGPTLAAAWLTKDLVPVHRVDTFDVGQLYLAVASLLNLVAIGDALGIADLRSAARRRAARAARGAGPAPEVPPAAALGHPPTAAQDEWPPPAALEPSALPPPPAATLPSREPSPAPAPDTTP